MLGRDIVLQAFRDYGVEYVFGNPGTTELPLMDGLVNYPDVQYVLALHEDIAVGMAAGYAHATGKPGVVNLHVTPGLAHGLGNLYDAYRAGVPLVVTAGQHDSRLSVQEPALCGDLVQMAQPFTKWSYEVRHVEELPVVLQRAFKVAMTEPCGPVFVSLPSNIMMQKVTAKPLPLTIVQQGTRPGEKTLSEAARLLLQAKNPVLLVGDRVGRMQAVEETVRLAETLAAKVFGEHQSSGINFPYTHPLFFGRSLPNGPYLKEILADADVLLMIGVTSQAPLLYFSEPIVSEGTKVIHIDCTDWEVGKNMHVHLPIVADIRQTLHELRVLVDRMLVEASGKEWAAAIEERRNHLSQLQLKRRAELDNALKEVWDSTPLSPARVVAEINPILPHSAFIVDESVTSGRYVHNYLSLDRPNSLIALKGGGLGYGMPAALGAQLARQDERVIAFIGDGSALYYMQALWNAVKYKLPVVYIIWNNASYMILKGGLQRMNGSAVETGKYIGMDITEPEVDFVACAQSFGVQAVRVTAAAEIRPAFERAVGSGSAFLIDVRIDGTVRPFLE